MKQFYKRFDSSMESPKDFQKKLQKIQSDLDCRFNYLEKRWMVIRWMGGQMCGEWNWVMTVQTPDAGAYMELCDYVLRRVKYLKKIFETDEVLKMIEAEEDAEEARKDAAMDNVYHELAKDTRKVLRNEFDGVVSNWNNFI